MDAGVLEKIEQQRSELEANIAQLKKSLRYWQTLEIEYEGLKEELYLLNPDATPDDCLRAARDFGPVLVNEAELKSLIQDPARQGLPQQIAELFAKRLDYVSRNVATVRRQLNEAGKKRNAILLAEDKTYRENAGMPLTEITEELDEDGGIVSSRLETRDSVVPQLAEALKKAGVKNVVDSKGTVSDDSLVDQSDSAITERKPGRWKQDSPQQESSASSRTSDVSHGPEDEAAVQAKRKVPTVAESDALASGIAKNSDPSQRDSEHNKYVVTNPHDTEDDAALRQEMIEYNLNEIGTIVAELDLAEDAAEFSYDEGESSEMFGETDDDDHYNTSDEQEEESEDERGMIKSPMITQSYRRKMEELQKKHGIEGLQNLGPSPEFAAAINEQLGRPPAAEAARNAAIARSLNSEKTSRNCTTPVGPAVEGKTRKKKVSFARDLDIETISSPKPTRNVADEPLSTKSSSTPMVEDIVERPQPPPNQHTASNSIKRISRFKTSQIQKSNTEQDATSSPGHSSKIVSNNLIERANPKPPRAPTSADLENEFDRRKLADDYYHLRNKMILRQGGFVNGGEDDNYGEAISHDLEQDEVTGRSRKVSRFKAARLR